MTETAITQWIQGYPDRALQLVQKSCMDAESHGDPGALCIARGVSLTTIFLYRREWPILREACNAAIKLSQQHGHLESETWARKLRGIALCHLGRSPVGLPLLREMIEAHRLAGHVESLPVDHAHEAECCISIADYPAAHAALDAAFEALQGSHENAWEPELLRIRGVLALVEGTDNPGTAERDLLRARELTQSRQALSLELRVTNSLARLWQQQDRVQEAHDLLSQVYDRFTEGFSTPDMHDTAELMIELASGVCIKPSDAH